MKKIELEKRVAELEVENKEWSERDDIVRKNLSGFLGSYKKTNYYNDEPDVKILKWSGIYFSLGKLVESKSKKEQDEVISRMERSLEELMQERAERNKNKENL